jgi:C4-dicarboxylate-specific signal transduction histidine kinase
MGKDGIVLASTDAAFMKQDYSFRDYFVKAIKGESYTDVNLGMTSKKLGYYFSYPIRDEKMEIIGVAVLKMNPEVISEVLKMVLEKPMADLMMTDRYGIVVNSDHGERLYQSIGALTQAEKTAVDAEKICGDKHYWLQYEPAMKLIRDKLKDVRVVKLYDEEDDDEEILVMTPIDKTGFYLVGEISMGEIVVQASEMARIIGFMIVLAVLASIALVVLLTSKMLGPIGKLTQMAREIASGKFSQSVSIVGTGELAVLEKSIVNMANELGGKYGDLELLVTQRTAAMEAQNETLEKGKLAILNILEDVGQAKADLEKFKLAVEDASDHIIITDAEGMVLYANKP